MERVKIESIEIHPLVWRELLNLAARHGKTPGDLIEALLQFQEMGHVVEDADFTGRLQVLWENALLNSVTISGEQEGCLCKEYYEWLKQLVKIGREQGDEAAMRWLEENPYKNQPTS
jgi:hypothetical protein